MKHTRGNHSDDLWDTEPCNCDGEEYHQKEASCKQVIRGTDNVIFDLIEISKKPNANIELLLKDAFTRGFNTGKEIAKRKAIEAIQQEK